MKLTPKQRIDLETAQYFIPSNTSFSPITEEDIRRYFAWSDRGIGNDDVFREARQTTTGLSALYWGKQRRDLQVTSYLEDWGSTCTSVDFVDEPESVVIFLSRVMKKPAIHTMWKLFNTPGRLDANDREVLEPLSVFKENKE